MYVFVFYYLGQGTKVICSLMLGTFAKIDKKVHTTQQDSPNVYKKGENRCCFFLFALLSFPVTLPIFAQVRERGRWSAPS